MANFGKEMIMLRGCQVLDVFSRSYTPKGESAPKTFRSASIYVPLAVSDPPAFYEISLASDDEMKILEQFNHKGTADIIIEKEMFGPKFTKHTFMGTFAEYLKSSMPSAAPVVKPEVKAA